MDREVSPSTLIASIRKARRDAAGTFTLDVAIEAPPGITILFGPSGAGKSTLLDCVAGLVRPDAGKIFVCNDILFDAAKRIDLSPQARRIAYVFQSLALFPHLTVQQNIAYGLSDLPQKERQARL